MWVNRVALILLMFVGATVFGQSQKELLRLADNYFKSENYEEALPLYKKLVNMIPTNTTYCYKYGSCVVMLNKNNREALDYLLQAEKNGKTDKEIAFFVGKAYQNEGEYEKATDYYERFMEVADKEQIKKLKVKRALKTCKKKSD